MIHYTSTALKVPGKKGEMVADKDGYYKVVLGAIGTKNRTGLNYPESTNRHHFESNSVFMEAVRNGNLYGENGHPYQRPGESVAAYVARASYVQEDRTCIHIKEIWLDDKLLAKDYPGVTVIFGKVKPDGELAHVAAERFKNKQGGLCFSIRCLKRDYIGPGSQRCRDMKSIVTFDLVNDGGMEHSRKQNAPGFECMSNFGHDLMDVPLDEAIVQEAIDLQHAVGRESNSMLKTALSECTIAAKNNLVLEMW